MEKVIFTASVLEYFDNLVFNLFEEEYFGFPESAREYVDKIVTFVLLSISNFPSKETPKPIKYLGTNYIFYKANNRTTWYIFFEKRERNYLITAIINNNSIEVVYL